LFQILFTGEQRCGGTGHLKKLELVIHLDQFVDTWKHKQMSVFDAFDSLSRQYSCNESFVWGGCWWHIEAMALYEGKASQYNVFEQYDIRECEDELYSVGHRGISNHGTI
jgi:hypothetical protein